MEKGYLQFWLVRYKQAQLAVIRAEYLYNLKQLSQLFFPSLPPYRAKFIGEGHLSTHYPNICFMYVSPCVHNQAHLCVYPHVCTAMRS